MGKYVCTICGYVFDESDGVLWDSLPDEWVCPLCGAGKSAFEIQVEKVQQNVNKSIELNEDIRKLQSYEMAALCSNLAKGCSKQYLEAESNAFLELEAYFMSKEVILKETSLATMIVELNKEISETFVSANAVVDEMVDRGSKRALVWSEKVTRMLKSILNKYQEEGDSYLEKSKVYVCEICGFIYVGNDLPKVCPVCKVPNFKMQEIRRD